MTFSVLQLALQYMMNSSLVCAAELLCALEAFARHTSSRITFLTLTIVGRSRGDVSSHQYVFQTFREREREAMIRFYGEFEHLMYTFSLLSYSIRQIQI